MESRVCQSGVPELERSSYSTIDKERTRCSSAAGAPAATLQASSAALLMGGLRFAGHTRACPPRSLQERPTKGAGCGLLTREIPTTTVGQEMHSCRVCISADISEDLMWILLPPRPSRSHSPIAICPVCHLLLPAEPGGLGRRARHVENASTYSGRGKRQKMKYHD